MKKIIAFLLVAMLIIPTFVVGENGENFDNTVTRAEFARIVAGLLGLSEIIRQAETLFVDVPIEHWASGYIASATVLGGYGRDGGGRGIVRGDGNSRFRPDDAILVEEAIAMLVRALGYAIMVNFFGGFPDGYAFAAERSGLTENIEFEFGEYATSELIYKLVNHALDTPLMMLIVPWPILPHNFAIMDGLDDRPLMTLRTHHWDNASVYFDGWDFVILDEEYETEEQE